MGYLRVYLDDSDVLSRIIECVPVVDIQRNPVFKTSKRKYEKSRFLASLLLKSVTGRDLEAGAGESFSSRWLTKGLGRNYRKYLEPLYLFAGDNLGYSVTAHTTKKYRMRPAVRTKVREAIRSYDGHERIVDHNGKLVGERRLRGNGNQCKTSEINLPAIVPVDLTTLNDTIETLLEVETDERQKGNLEPDVSEHIDQLCDLRRWVRATGGIPNLYREEATGRLGRLGEFHIVGSSNTLRMLLFRGSGWVDFDFANCHYSIFRSLCAYHGYDTPYVEEYLQDRKRIANQFWSAFQIPPADTKKVFLSLLYGGGLVAHGKTTSTKLLSYPLMKALSEDPWAIALEEEVRTGGDAILSEHERIRKHTRFVTRNVVGRETTAKKKASRLSHVITGFERWCLETVCREFNDIQCLIYDGWISPDRDVSDLENRILERSITELGFPIDMQIKRKPIPDSVDDILGI